MTRQSLLYALCGLALVAVLIGGVTWFTRGNHLELTGKITNVRTLSLDENSSLLVADFHVENPSDVQFVVRSVMPQLTAADASKPEAQHIADSDTERIFEYYKDKLGARQHPTLLMKQKIAAHQSLDRMVAARFEVPEAILKARKELSVRLEDVDGAVSVIQ